MGIADLQRLFNAKCKSAFIIRDYPTQAVVFFSKSQGDFAIYCSWKHMPTVVIDVFANQIDAAGGFYNDVRFVGVYGHWCLLLFHGKLKPGFTGKRLTGF